MEACPWIAENVSRNEKLEMVMITKRVMTKADVALNDVRDRGVWRRSLVVLLVVRPGSKMPSSKEEDCREPE